MAAEAVGSAYVIIRAVTNRLAGDIKDGLDKGAKDADAEKAGKDIGDRVGESAGEEFGTSFNKTAGEGLEESADSSEMKRGQDRFTDKLFKNLHKNFEGQADELGVTLGDGVNEGLSQTEISESTRRHFGGIGEDLADEAGDDFDVTWKRNTAHTITTTDEDSGVDNSLRRMGSRLARKLKDAFQTNFIPSDIAKPIAGAFAAIPTIAWAAVLALPALGGAMQLIGALLGSIVAMIGFIVTAAAGAVVALAGIGAALLPAFGVLKLAFATDSDLLDEFNEHLDQFKTLWEEVGLATQETLLPALAGALDELTALIPIFADYGAVIGGVVGNIAFMAAQELTTPSNLQFIDEILRSGAEVVEILGEALVLMIEPMLRILRRAMPLARRFAESIRNAAERFADFIERADNSGALSDTFNTWYDRLAQIGRILGDVFVGLWNILSIGGDESEGVFAGFEQAAQGFRDFTSSADGKNKIATFFSEALKIGHEFWLLIKDIVALIAAPMLGDDNSEGLVGFLSSFRTEWLPRIVEFAGKITDAVGMVWNLIQTVATFVSSVINSELVQTLIGMFEELTGFEFDGDKMITFGLAALFVASMLGKLGLLAPGLSLFGSVLGGLTSIIGSFAGALFNLGKILLIGSSSGQLGGLAGLVASLGPIGIAIAAIVAAITLLYFHVKPFRDFVDTYIIDPLQRLWTAIGGFQGIVDFFRELPANIVAFAQALPGLISDFVANLPEMIDGLITQFERLPAMLAELLSGVPEAIGNLASSMFDALGDFLSSDTLSDIINNVVDWIIETFQDMPSKIGNMAGDFVKSFASWFTKAAPRIYRTLGQLIGTLLRFLINAAIELGAAFIGFLTDLPSIIGKQGPVVGGALLKLVKALPGYIASAADGIFDFLLKAISALPDLISGVLKSAGNFLLGFFEGVWPEAVAWIQENGPKIIEAVVNFFRDLPGKIWGAIQGLGSFFAGLPGQIWEWIKSGASALWDAVPEIWDWITDHIGDAAETLVDFFQGLPGRFWGWIMSAAHYFWEQVPGIWDWITDHIGYAAEGLVNFFQDLPMRFWGWISSAAHYFWEAVPEIWGWILDHMGAPLEGLVNFFQDLPSRMWAWISSASHYFTDAVGAIWDWLWDGLRATFETITSLPGDILAKVMGIGGAIIEAIGNGISRWLEEDAPSWVRWIAEHLFGWEAPPEFTRNDLPFGIGEMFTRAEEKIAEYEGIKTALGLMMEDAFGDGVQWHPSGDMSLLGLEDFIIDYTKQIEDAFGPVGEAGAEALHTALSESLLDDAKLDGSEKQAIIDMIMTGLQTGNWDWESVADTAAQGFGTSVNAKLTETVTKTKPGKAAAEAIRTQVENELPYIPLPNLDSENVAGWASSQAEVVASDFTKNVTDLKGKKSLASAGSPMMEQLREGLEAGRKALQPFGLGLVLQIVQWIRTTVKLMRVLGTEMIGALGEGLTIGLLAVQILLMNVPKRFVAAFGDPKSILRPVGVNIVTGLIEGITAGLVALAVSLLGLRTRITTALSGVTLYAAGVSLIGGLAQGISAAAGTAILAAGLVLLGIQNAFRNAGTFLYDEGQALIDGLIRGIQSRMFALSLTVGAAQLAAGGARLANGAIVNSPTFALIGEAGREAVIPLTRPTQALALMQQSGLDNLVRQNDAKSGFFPDTNGDVAIVKIEEATFYSKVDVDMVAARMGMAYRNLKRN